ncbi:hypothetical protein OS493_039814 [Desmophyllum pertusum]|uniref:Uncharacterized protein n=1 Tax=Desmophyllum pertusum TaxID=174260 RepID=A0A9W9YV60_9CNID|nr:hypothetical protein OS493_039814 [Desmophyllum pertusum]
MTNRLHPLLVPWCSPLAFVITPSCRSGARNTVLWWHKASKRHVYFLVDKKQILREISSCQKAVLNELELGPNIARNTALSENVFMMVVCIELRIPLFVVGKPGSSKSLAKTVVADNMQGDAARSELFKTFKQDSALGICSTDKQVKTSYSVSDISTGRWLCRTLQRTEKFCNVEEMWQRRIFRSFVTSTALSKWFIPSLRNLAKDLVGINWNTLSRETLDDDDDVRAETSTTIRLIEASLGREDVADRTNFSENRYLLILTENYAALPIMQQHLLKTADDAVVIFGSSFPNDQEYTQYYVYFGGQKYVDLGLGTHRVKCRVHDDFKLIVIAEKDVVYNTFPIPLINRLRETLPRDFNKFDSRPDGNWDFSTGDAFVGYHEDTIPSIVMQVCNDIEEEDVLPDDTTEDTWEMKVLRRCQKMLLEMAAT